MEYQEMGSEASRRKFLTANQSLAGVPIDDGTVDSDDGPEPAQNSLSVASNRGKKTADKRGTSMPGKGIINQKAALTAEVRHSTREITSRRK